MVIFPAKILIAGGFDQHYNVTNIVEIVDLINPNFALKWNDDRATRRRSIGGILQSQPLICGGFDRNLKNFDKNTCFLGNVFVQEIICYVI